MKKIKIVRAFLRLTRWNEWVLTAGFAVFGYLLSFSSIGSLDSFFSLIIVFVFSFSFGFAINDYFDAPFDKLKTVIRNPISRGDIKKSHAAAFCFMLFATGIVLGFFMMPPRSFIPMTFLFLVFFAYSSPPFRMKERRFLGIITHGLFYPLLFGAAYMLNSVPGIEMLLLSLSVFTMSIVVDMTQEVRDTYVDKISGFRTTVLSLGYERSLQAITVMSVLAVAAFVATIVVYRPLYLCLMAAGFIPYFRLLLSKPKRKDIFDKTLKSWNVGIVVSAATGIVLLPFYIGLM